MAPQVKVGFFKNIGTVSLDNQPRFPKITIGSCGEVVVNYLIFAGILYSKQIILPTILAIEPEPKILTRHGEPATVSEDQHQD